MIARTDGPVRRPRDLEGRRVGVTGLPSDDAVVDSEVAADGGDPAKVDRVTIGFNAVANLAAGKVDAATGFWNAEAVALRATAGSRSASSRSIATAPRATRSWCSVTSAASLEQDPDLVRAVVTATTRGYRADAAGSRRRARCPAGREPGARP